MVRALGMAEIATWIRHHHERWDGRATRTAWPASEIPLPAGSSASPMRWTR